MNKDNNGLRIRGKEIVYLSRNRNISVAYNKFGLGSRYSVYKAKGKYWLYVITFTTIGEAIEYARKMADEPYRL